MNLDHQSPQLSQFMCSVLMRKCGRIIPSPSHQQSFKCKYPFIAAPPQPSPSQAVLTSGFPIIDAIDNMKLWIMDGLGERRGWKCGHLLGNIQVWRHQEVPATSLGKYDTWWRQCWDRGGWSSKIWHDDGILWQCCKKHHKTLKSSTRRYTDCHILHFLHRYNKYDRYYCIPLSFFLTR